MKNILLVLLMLPLVNALPFAAENLDSAVSVGAYYNIDLNANTTFVSSIPCLVTFKDAFNNTVKSYTSDPNYNIIKLDTNGYVKSFVTIDDRFLVAQNYTLIVSCGQYDTAKDIFIDVPGDLDLTKYIWNLTAGYKTHPENYFWYVVVGIIIISFALYLYGAFRRRRYG